MKSELSVQLQARDNFVSYLNKRAKFENGLNNTRRPGFEFGEVDNYKDGLIAGSKDHQRTYTGRQIFRCYLQNA